MYYTEKDVINNWYCPYCNSKNVEIKEWEKFVSSYEVYCYDCNKKASYFDNWFKVTFHTCDKCGSHNFEMRHNWWMTPCDYKCRDCWTIKPGSFDWTIIKL